jgi:hypothetical protein
MALPRNFWERAIKLDPALCELTEGCSFSSKAAFVAIPAEPHRIAQVKAA